ncbi:MAG: hypothetical protein Q4C46_07675 [Bacillota bacterium]|nr:hypothetical protein [Bacillota bacterium]
MKKRIFSIVLSLCMVLALVPATVFAENADYSVTFEFDHGTIQSYNSPVSETWSNLLDSLTMPSLDSGSYEPYVFLGWKIKGSNSSEVIPAGKEIDDSNIKEDTTFVAVFKTVDITYEFDHGTLPADRQTTETIEQGDYIDFPELENCGEYKL